MRKGGSKAKGSAFERRICKQLSCWWTENEREDVFWLTSGSGARAKIRRKSNQQTFGQYGDIQATDPIGQPLLDLCTIELKKGYPKATIHDLLDRKERNRPPFENFLFQCWEDSENADVPYWILITERNQFESLVTIPKALYNEIIHQDCSLRIYPRAFAECYARNGIRISIFTTHLWAFLERVTPDVIRGILL